MCGIFGFWAKDPLNDSELNAVLLRAATHSLAHRGPDDEGAVGWTVDGQLLKNGQLSDQALRLGLGHTRLSILDLSDAGHQPMQGPDGSWLVFNGEIYNYRDIRQKLTSFGYCFKTGTDTEVILAAYAEWGETCVEKFNGMWAFVLYDPQKRCLFLSRDRLGIKPLYYVLRANGFFFASEVCALFECPEIKPLIVREQLAKYLIDHKIDDGPDTIYKDIKELRGGHCKRFNLDTGEYRTWQFWDLLEEPDLELSDGAALDRFSELIEDSVRLRLHADVPVAITLSGGIDSSVVSVAAAQLRGVSVQTFTSRHDKYPDIDESQYAAQVARALSVQPTFIEPLIDRMLLEESLLTRHQAMPFGSLSLYVHWAILTKIRSLGVPVVLSGQGGDELFLGYERYYVSVALAMLPNLWQMSASLLRASLCSQLSFFQITALASYYSWPELRRYFRLRRIRDVYQSSLLSLIPPPEPRAFANLRELQKAEVRRRSLSILLRFDDRTAAAHGMETRLPFLDYRLVEFAYRLPLHQKIRDGWTKYLLRRYLERHVPAAVAWRKHKLGFNAPQAVWTDSLIKAHGEHLQSIPFARRLLVKDFDIYRATLPVRWDVYNLLHLADLLQWEFTD